jgi:hypothetical protein
MLSSSKCLDWLWVPLKRNIIWFNEWM